LNRRHQQVVVAFASTIPIPTAEERRIEPKSALIPSSAFAASYTNAIGNGGGVANGRQSTQKPNVNFVDLIFFVVDSTKNH
jgi:5-formyltetrahydrofolate cyclo-ligase